MSDNLPAVTEPIAQEPAQRLSIQQLQQQQLQPSQQVAQPRMITNYLDYDTKMDEYHQILDRIQFWTTKLKETNNLYMRREFYKQLRNEIMTLQTTWQSKTLGFRGSPRWLEKIYYFIIINTLQKLAHLDPAKDADISSAVGVINSHIYVLTFFAILRSQGKRLESEHDVRIHLQEVALIHVGGKEIQSAYLESQREGWLKHLGRKIDPRTWWNSDSQSVK